MHSYQIFHQHQQHERQAETRALLKSFQHLSEQWQLTKKESHELLNLNSLHQMAHWQQNIDDFLLTDLQIERLSFLLSIHKVLEKTLNNSQAIAEWIHDPHPEIEGFDTTSALEAFTKANKKELSSQLSALTKLFNNQRLNDENY